MVIFEEMLPIEIKQLPPKKYDGEPLNVFFGWTQGTAVTIIPTPYQPDSSQGPFEYKDRFPRYGDSRVKDETVARPSYL